jgi:hypothetical protein
MCYIYISCPERRVKTLYTHCRASSMMVLRLCPPPIASGGQRARAVDQQGYIRQNDKHRIARVRRAFQQAHHWVVSERCLRWLLVCSLLIFGSSICFARAGNPAGELYIWSESCKQLEEEWLHCLFPDHGQIVLTRDERGIHGAMVTLP